MKIQELQDWVAADWQKHPENITSQESQCLLLVEEVGEVAEAIRKLDGRKERASDKPDIGSEMADVLISLVTLANSYQVDLTAEIDRFQVRLAERRST